MTESVKINEDKEFPATPVKEAPKPIEMGERGLVLKDNEELVRLAKIAIKSGHAPAHIKTWEEYIVAWHFASSLGLVPMAAIAEIAVIEGRPSLFGGLPMSLAAATGEIEIYKEFLIDKEYREICYENKNLQEPYIGAIAFIKRKGREKNSYHFTIDDAKKAGLWDKKTRSGNDSVWIKYPKDMLLARVRSRALKIDFADALKGAGIAEHDYNIMPGLRDVTPEQTGADELKEAFGDTGGADKTA